MTGRYDEMSPRSFADYPGGTTRQRWLRALLRRVMEAQGFTVYSDEWWHFDYRTWADYPIGNARFSDLGSH
jgi:D-alanyl-D-alanine dipeptidase